MNSHPNTISRVTVATKVMRENGIAPPILMMGPDFHVERSAGTSVMKDFFTFQSKLAPPEKLAELLAKIHSIPTNWYEKLKELFFCHNIIFHNYAHFLICKEPANCFSNSYSASLISI